MQAWLSGLLRNRSERRISEKGVCLCVSAQQSGTANAGGREDCWNVKTIGKRIINTCTVLGSILPDSLEVDVATALSPADTPPLPLITR